MKKVVDSKRPKRVLRPNKFKMAEMKKEKKDKDKNKNEKKGKKDVAPLSKCNKCQRWTRRGMIKCDKCKKWLCKACTGIKTEDDMIEIEEMTESKGVKWFCTECEDKLKEAQDFQDENQMEKGRVASLNWLLDTREKDIIEKSKLIKENEKEIMLLKQKRQEEIEKIESYKIKIKE